LLSIAVDVQGPTVVRPYTQKAGVTFPVTVDTADVFGQAFGLKAIPVTFLVDEVGIIRLRGDGPNAALLAQIEAVLQEPLSPTRATMPQLATARPKDELEKTVARRPDDWRSRLALAQVYYTDHHYADALSQLESAARLQPRESSIPFLWGLVLLQQNQKDKALNKLKLARDLDPENWRIHKQIWALEHPDKFYTGHSPDFGWQREELIREKNAQKVEPSK
jgi:tetratricopeptide (TPR) repeat protein